MPNNKSSGIAYTDPALDGATIANSTITGTTFTTATLTSPTITSPTITGTGTATLTSVTTGAIAGNDSSLGIDGLASGTGGAVVVTGGTSSTATTAGGAVTLKGGTGNTSGSGGAANLTGGIGGATGIGGQVNITGGVPTDAAGGAVVIAGAAGVGTNRAGGLASLTGGAGIGSASGGAIAIASGAAGATGVAGTVSIAVGAATAGAGSALTITGGNGAGGTAAGGNINLVPGTAVSTGIPGEITVNSVAGTFEVTYTAPLMTTVVPASGTAQPFYIATRAVRVKAAYACVVTHGTSETFAITKDASAGAPGSGTNVLAAVITIASSNVPATQAASATIATCTLAAGDRLSFLTAGTIGAAAGLTITVLMVPV